MTCKYDDKSVTLWNGKEHYNLIKDCMCSFFSGYLGDALSESREKYIARLKRYHIWSCFSSPDSYYVEAVGSKGVYIELRQNKYRTKLTWKATSELLRQWALQAKNKEDYIMAALDMRKTGPKVSINDTKNLDLDKFVADNADNVVEVSVNEITPFKYKGLLQPFGIRDDEVAVLAESFETYGQLTPCAIREYKNKYQMISGHKRLAAARKLGLDTLKCIVIECDDKTAFELVKHFNISRDKPLPSEICELVKQTKEKNKESDEDDLTITEIAKLFGVGRKHIYRCYVLRNLPASYAKAADRDILAPALLEKIINNVMSEHIDELGEWLEYQEKKVSGSKLKKIYEFSALCATSGEEFSVDSINRWLDNYDSNKANDNGDGEGEPENTVELSVDLASFLAQKRAKLPALLDKSDDEILSLIDILLFEHFKE